MPKWRVLATASLITTEAGTQQVVRVPDDVACPSCRIATRPVATLGDSDGPGSISGPPNGVRSDGRGRYWVWGRDNGGGPAVFDAGGRFIRSAGRRGQGPGEFVMVADVIPVPGDSVLVMDYYRRATLFAPDLTMSRILQLGATLAQSLVVDWPRSIVGFSHYAAGDRGGHVLHSMSFDSTPARITRSFGPSWAMPDVRTMETASRSIAQSARGLWAAPAHPYRIEHWTADGRNDHVIERTPAWPARTAGGFGNRDTPPPNSVNAIADFGDGRLWVFINTAASTWREGWPKGEGELRASAFSFEKMVRTLVEVIDPASGRVLARRQLDEWIVATLPGHKAVIYMVGADDIPRLRVVRLALEGTPP